MAKKGGNKKSRCCRTEEPEESLSAPSTHDEPSEVDDDQFDSLIDELWEKRAATRCHALNKLVQLLSCNCFREECITRETTLVRQFLSSIRRGSRMEALPAARGLGVLVVTLGLDDGAARVWADCREPLMEFAGNKLKSVETRCAAIDSFAIACFVAESDPLATLEAMSWLCSMWSADSHSVREAAIRGWTLLLTTVSAELVDDIFDDVVDKLIKLLDDAAVDVRRASGEAVALLYGFGVELDADETDYSDGASSVASNSTGLSRMSGIEYAMDRMKDLAGPRGQTKKRSKKDRAAMRSAVRGVCNFVEEGVVQEVRIKLRGTTLVVDDLPGLIQVNFVRKILSGGFQAHLHCNELLHQMFQYSPGEGPAPRLTKSEKRMLRSPHSTANKLRTKERKSGHIAKMEMLEGCCF